MTKEFTAKETEFAKITGSRHFEHGAQNQSRRGKVSGAVRRDKAVTMALAGTTSRKTAKTAYMNLLHSMWMLDSFLELESFKKSIFRFAKSKTLLESFLLACENIQRVGISKGLISTMSEGLAVSCYSGQSGHKKQKIFNDGISKNPFESFKNVCAQVEDFVSSIIKEFSESIKSAANHSNIPSTSYKLENLSSKSGYSSIDSIFGKPKSLRLPSELYSIIRTTVSKMLPEQDFKQILGKLADCFTRNDKTRFDYVLSEASKGRSIFAKSGKSTAKKARNVVIDTAAGKLGFLSDYGVASDKQTGFIYA